MVIVTKIKTLLRACIQMKTMNVGKYLNSTSLIPSDTAVSTGRIRRPGSKRNNDAYVFKKWKRRLRHN